MVGQRGTLLGDSLGTPGRIEEAATEPRLAKTRCGSPRRSGPRSQDLRLVAPRGVRGLSIGRKGLRGRPERCEDGEHMCSPLHYRLPDTTQQHQTHHGDSYPASSQLSSHWVRPLQPSTAVTHCPTASYPLQHFYNTLQHSTVYSSTAFLQSTTSTTPLWYVLFGYLSDSVAHFCCPLKGILGMLTEMAVSLASESTWHFCHAGLRDHAELIES